MIALSYEETNPSDIDQSLVENLLKGIFPDITADEISFYYHGTYNVFVVKNKYIFRFPDASLYNSKGFEMIKNEERLLRAIRGSLSFEIPNPIYCSEDVNNPFVGYKKIPGISLSRIYEKTSIEERIKLGLSIGRFLTEYHSPELCLTVSKDLFGGKRGTPEDHFVSWAKEYEEVKKIVFPRIEKNSIRWLQKVFENYLEQKENFQFDPTLVHGDFDTSNILVNPGTLQITGIIDFEEARISDPAQDLIFIEEGEIFSNAVIKTYQGNIDSSLEDRIRFYFCRAGTAYILYGVKNNIPQLANYGKLMIKKRMNMIPYF